MMKIVPKPVYNKIYSSISNVFGPSKLNSWGCMFLAIFIIVLFQEMF